MNTRKLALGWFYALLAREISGITRYVDRLYELVDRRHGDNLLLPQINCPRKSELEDLDQLPDERAKGGFSAVLLNGTLNHELDIQQLLIRIRAHQSRNDRIIAVMYNPYLRFIFAVANMLGIRRGPMPTTFVTRTDLHSLARLSGYEIVRTRLVGYCPWRLLGIGSVINVLMPVVPLLRWLSLVYLVVLRPIIPQENRPTLSVVVPVRNEKGNIQRIVGDLDAMTGLPIAEVIFVEGHSTDGTWEEIAQVTEQYKGPLRLRALRQEKRGKSDAVRKGFAAATGEIFTILDGDLTVPAAQLVRYYDAYCQGHGDFINGSRLVYPGERDSMRPLNRMGNIFFAKMLSGVLDSRLGDALCGTKMLSAGNYARVVRWREDFGDFDPFGDFELLFPAAILGLGIVDLPIHYKARRYGATSIHRFRDGWRLLCMAVIGFVRVRLGPLVFRSRNL